MVEGIRQGRARSISDATRRRAKEALAERNDGKSYNTPAESFKVSMGKKAKASPITKNDYACGGKVKKAAGGSISKRADGIAQRGKTRGKYI